MEIRAFRDSDAADVSALIRRALIEVNSVDYAPSVIEHLCEMYSVTGVREMAGRRAVFLAVDDDQIVGTVSLQDDTVFGLFVDPAAHRRGIGAKLMAQVESLARQNGHASIVLPASITAYPFYLKLGYRKVRDHSSDETGDTIIMSKSIQ